MAAAEFGDRLSAELARVADSAELVGVDAALVELVSAGDIEAGRAVLLVLHTVAHVAAALALGAGGKDGVLVDNNDIVGLDHDSCRVLFRKLNVDLWDLDLDARARAALKGRRVSLSGGGLDVVASGKVLRGVTSQVDSFDHSLNSLVEFEVFFVAKLLLL